MILSTLGGRFEEPQWDKEFADDDPFREGTVVVTFGDMEVCRLPAEYGDSNSESVERTIAEWLAKISRAALGTSWMESS